MRADASIPTEGTLLRVIEIVDAADDIEAFLPPHDRLLQEDLVTPGRAGVCLYRGPAAARE